MIHNIDPVFDSESEILILGSFPSVKSREEGFFYGHPRNRFWQVIAGVCGENTPVSIAEKKELLLKHHIALWDVIQSCNISGSADSTIKDVTVNDICSILKNTKIKRIFTNGRKAESYYQKYARKNTGIDSVCLPSTSPANAAWSRDRLLDFWREKLNIS